MPLDFKIYKKLLREIIIKDTKSKSSKIGKTERIGGSEELSVLIRDLSEKGIISVIDQGSVDSLNSYLELVGEDPRATSKDMGGGYYASYMINDKEELVKYLCELDSQSTINPLIDENIREYLSIVDTRVGHFILYTNGLITYKEKHLKLEPRHQELFILLLKKANDRVLYDDFKEIFPSIDIKTITKYIAELKEELSQYPLDIKNIRAVGYILIYPKR